ncbi:MAG: GNAT family N-acetyltransferase [Pilosibacter sp.]
MTTPLSNFSVFPSHYYLYGFEVEESCRGKGYGTKFLSTVLAQLLNGNAAAIEHSPLSPETSYHISDVRSAGAAADNTAPRPVLLQVSGGNAPALTLYKKTGFRITETLCCYLY